MLTRLIAVSLVALSAMAVVVPAGAAERTSVTVGRQEVVRYGDLDLTTVKGARILLLRVQHAANHVCDVYPTLDAGTLRAQQECVGSAVAGAVAMIGNPIVTGLANGTALPVG